MPTDQQAAHQDGTERPEPTIFVLFGASGDLSRRMVFPAFFELFRRGLTPQEWMLIGGGRSELSDEEFRDRVHESLTEFGPGEDLDEQQWADFADRLRFAGGGFEESDPGTLLDVVDESRQRVGEEATLVHYLAVPPNAFGPLTTALSRHGLLEGAKVVYEKPYGESLQGFRELDELVGSELEEDQIFRIDHFLGKEATQNLHVLRFANRMINNIWNGDAVAQVQIDAPETLDVAQRAAFYDATGAFKDMIVTHLFQVAAEVAMEPPASMAAEDLQAARESVLGAFRSLTADDVVFGQFEGYRELDEIADDSRTDTFAAVRLWVDTDRWRDVPFLLRSGKQLAADHELVTLIMKETEGPFGDLPDAASRLEISLAGSGAIQAVLILKRPGPDLALAEERIDLSLSEIADAETMDPYVALLEDVLKGDRSLFTSSAGLAEAWRTAETIVNDPPEPVSYPKGSWGPEQAADLTDGLGWVTETTEQPD